MSHREYSDKVGRITGSARAEEVPGVFMVKESCTDSLEQVRLPKCQVKHPDFWVLTTEGQWDSARLSEPNTKTSSH